MVNVRPVSVVMVSRPSVTDRVTRTSLEAESASAMEIRLAPVKAKAVCSVTVTAPGSVMTGSSLTPRMVMATDEVMSEPPPDPTLPRSLTVSDNVSVVPSSETEV